MAMKKKIDANRLNLKDEVVSINRVTKVVKGGTRRHRRSR